MSGHQKYPARRMLAFPLANELKVCISWMKPADPPHGPMQRVDNGVAGDGDYAPQRPDGFAHERIFRAPRWRKMPAGYLRNDSPIDFFRKRRVPFIRP